MKVDRAFLIFCAVLGLSFPLPTIHAVVCGGESFCSCGDTLTSSRNFSEESLSGCRYNGLTINTSNVILDCGGGSIKGMHDSSLTGIAVFADNVTLINCIVENFHCGICAYGSSNSKIICNSVHFNRALGIGLYENSSSNLILNNSASFNGWDGIYVENSSDNFIIYNSAQLNTNDGIHLFHNARWNYVANNFLEENGAHSLASTLCQNYIVDESNFGIEGKTIKYVQNSNRVLIGSTQAYSEIIFCNVTDSIISNVTMDNGPQKTDGILLVESSRNLIVNSSFNNVRAAVYLYSSSQNNFIINNTMKNSDYGIRMVLNSSKNRAEGNNLAQNDFDFAAESSENNYFLNNTLEGRTFSFSYTGDIEFNSSNGDLAYHGDIDIFDDTGNPSFFAKHPHEWNQLIAIYSAYFINGAIFQWTQPYLLAIFLEDFTGVNMY